MKSFRYKTQGSMIRGIKETPRKKKFVVWDQVIYLAILLGFILSALFYFAYNKFFVHARAEVVLDSFTVHLPVNAQLTRMLVKEGDTVKKGDTLFLSRTDFRDTGFSSKSATDTAGKEKSTDWYQKEVLMTLKNLQLKKIDLRESDKAYRQRKAELKPVEEKVFLEVYSAGKLYELRQKIEDAAKQSEKLRQEIAYLNRYLGMLYSGLDVVKRVSLQRSLVAQTKASEAGAAFLSPVSGVVTHVFKKEQEVSYHGESIMTITDFSGHPFVRAYIRQRDIKYCEVGDRVSLEFLDGTECKGRISAVDTETVPPENYDPAYTDPPKIIAEIVPVNPEDLEKWRYAFKLGVQMTKPKFF